MWQDFNFMLRYLRHRVVATRNGHGVHSPFAFRLCEEVFYNPQRYYDFAELNSLRKKLLADNREIEFEDFGAGSKRLGKKRRICDIARHGISTQSQSEILYRLVAWLRPAHVVELGASLGLNTLYLAKGCPQAQVTSIEGSKQLSVFSQSFTSGYVSNINVLQGAFDDVLPGILADLQGDSVIYIDGNHREEATLRYFEQCASNCSVNSVIVVDDINWSEGMRRAWQKMAGDDRVTLAMDAFFTGYLFFTPAVRQKQVYRIIT